MKQIALDQEPLAISGDLNCDLHAPSTHRELSSDQTQNLIMSIVEAVQAGLDGLPELRDQLIREAELRYASPK